MALDLRGNLLYNSPAIWNSDQTICIIEIVGRIKTLLEKPL